MIRPSVPLFAVVLCLGVAACSGTPPDTLGVVEGRLAPCPETPNCVHTGDRHPAGTAPFMLLAEAPDGLEALARIVEEMPRMRVVERSAEYLRAEERSRLFRFVDDVEFLRLSTGELVVRSASRLGEGDMGVNGRRIERLRVLLTDAGLLRNSP